MMSLRIATLSFLVTGVLQQTVATGIEPFQDPVEEPKQVEVRNVELESVNANALKWIADHQLPDGSWSFDHTIGPGDHRDSPNPGSLKNAKNAATAMALLPFLAAGQTHVEGKNKDVIQAGLSYLIANQKKTEFGGTFQEPGGTMYSHGLASIALCEAYAISGDMKLVKPSQNAIDFIVHAQDPAGGGWRYVPHLAGDTSVSGWQINALKTAHLAGLEVPRETIDKATAFLDSVSLDDGAFYGYTGPKRSTTNTCIGLECRMEIGWDNLASLEKGMKFISAEGPSLEAANMYHNFLASQALFSYGRISKAKDDEMWTQWNKKLRELLLTNQEKKGPASGSWFFGHDYARGGGRLYDTVLSTLCLQIYDRNLTRWQHAGEGFKIEQ